ncbi:MAG: hypothetical protein JO253_08125 [Alphaproteobacteria bacterium]|nr:hypothetical protein [Alphaproteobacteria bacterium]
MGGAINPISSASYGVLELYPSGDTTGVTDLANIQTALNLTAQGAKMRLRKGTGAGNYYVNAAIQMPTNGHLDSDAGVTIQLVGGVLGLAGCSWSSSVNPTQVTVPNVAGITAGMLVSDAAGNLAAGTPFVGMPFGARIINIVGNILFLSANVLTTNANGTLNFHVTDNVITCQSVSNFSITCRDGWLNLDGNYAICYPYDVTSQDGLRNALYMNQVNDFLVDGVCGQNAIYHGFQCTGPNSGAKIGRYRGYHNGFRDIQLESGNTVLHGTVTATTSSPTLTGVGTKFTTELSQGDTVYNLSNALIGTVLTITSDTVATLVANAAVAVTAAAIQNARSFRDNQITSIEASFSGWQAFRTRQGSEVNAGVFIAFANNVNTQVGSIRVKNSYGNGVAITGGINQYLTGYPTAVTKRFQVGQIIAESCGYGVALYNGLSKSEIGPINAAGTQTYIPTGCDTVSASSYLVYYVDTNGTEHSIKARDIDLPTGSIAAYGIQFGQRIVMSGGTTGMNFDGATIWTITPGGGAGGKDRVSVIYENNEASDPYTTAATNTWAHIWSVRGSATFWSTSPGTGTPLKDIKIASIESHNCAKGAILCSNYSTTTYDYLDIDIGFITADGGVQGINIGGWQNFSFGALRQRDLGSYNPHINSAGQDSFINNCSGFEIRNFSHEQFSAAYTDGGTRLKLDANCRDGIIYAKGLLAPASLPAIQVLTPSGAGANSVGSTGPIVLVNPTGATGATLTVAASQISRVDATACIITRPSDSP